MTFKKIEQAEHESVEPDYKGNEGWIDVAVGIGGKAVVIDYDGSFGAFCWMIDAVGGDDPEELGLDAWPEDPGVYRGHFKVWTTSVHDYDGSDNDMGFNHHGEWETLWEPGPVPSNDEDERVYCPKGCGLMYLPEKADEHSCADS